jgi:hypothetical protein
MLAQPTGIVAPLLKSVDGQDVFHAVLLVAAAVSHLHDARGHDADGHRAAAVGALLPVVSQETRDGRDLDLLQVLVHRVVEQPGPLELLDVACEFNLEANFETRRRPIYSLGKKPGAFKL